VILYHGSDKIIKKPEFGKGSKFNDYGLGFYTTPYFDLAAEWAVPSAESNGYVNKYSLSIDDLNTLDMDKEPFEHWISILLKNRGGKFSRLTNDSMQRFIQKYPFDISGFDVIKGWRADDSYFQFVRDFCSYGLSLEKLSVAMSLGEFGTQYCIISLKAFENLKFIGPAIEVKASVYNKLRVERDDAARQAYADLPDKRHGKLIDDIVGRE